MPYRSMNKRAPVRDEAPNKASMVARVLKKPIEKNQRTLAIVCTVPIYCYFHVIKLLPLSLKLHLLAPHKCDI